jgi:hypothetical protein
VAALKHARIPPTLHRTLETVEAADRHSFAFANHPMRYIDHSHSVELPRSLEFTAKTLLCRHAAIQIVQLDSKRAALQTYGAIVLKVADMRPNWICRKARLAHTTN